MNSFQDFLVTNGVLSVGSGVIFGVATLYWIRSVSHDIVTPTLDLALLGVVRWINPAFAKRMSSALFANASYRLSSFFRETVTWVITLVAAFAIFHHVFRRFAVLRRSHEREREREKEKQMEKQNGKEREQTT
jgi:large-conductance mechanosensitive channel